MHMGGWKSDVSSVNIVNCRKAKPGTGVWISISAKLFATVVNLFVLCLTALSLSNKTTVSLIERLGA